TLETYPVEEIVNDIDSGGTLCKISNKRWEHEIIEIITYLLDNENMLKFKNNDYFKSRLSDPLLDIDDERVAGLIEKLGYKLSLYNVIDILDSDSCVGLQILRKQNVKMSKDILENIPCVDCKLLLRLEKAFGIDIRKYIDLGDLHRMMLTYEIDDSITDFLEYIGIGITPYTLEVYLRISKYYLMCNYKKNDLEYFINKLNRRITAAARDSIISVFNCNSKRIKEINLLLDQCEIIHYEPTDEERVEMGGMMDSDSEDSLPRPDELEELDELL
ncbi:MAG: hypothetical protein Harvfovirus80_5, partial [Harvfovirus sp.]